MPIRPKNRAQSDDVSRAPEPSPKSSSDTSTIIVRQRVRVRGVPPTTPDLISKHDDTPAAVPPAAASPAEAKRAHHVVDKTGPNWDENGEYIVGKGRPPRHSRWSKGQSGNPKGPKPKEKLDPLTEFERELTSDFAARVNGKDVILNNGTFGLQLLKTNAAKGSVKAQQILIELFLDAVHKQAERDSTPEVLAWEQQIIDQMLKDHKLLPKPVVRRERDDNDDGDDQ